VEGSPETLTGSALGGSACICRGSWPAISAYSRRPGRRLGTAGYRNSRTPETIFTLPRRSRLRRSPSVDLRGECPAVYNQGRIGSCTANAIAAAFEFEFDLMKQHLQLFAPSRLFIFIMNEKSKETSLRTPVSRFRDGSKSVATLGVCSENEWPYDDTPAESYGGPFPPGARDGEKPSAQCYQDPLDNRVTTYSRVLRDPVLTRFRE